MVYICSAIPTYIPPLHYFLSVCLHNVNSAIHTHTRFCVHASLLPSLVFHLSTKMPTPFSPTNVAIVTMTDVSYSYDD